MFSGLHDLAYPLKHSKAVLVQVGQSVRLINVVTRDDLSVCESMILSWDLLCTPFNVHKNKLHQIPMQTAVRRGAQVGHARAHRFTRIPRFPLGGFSCPGLGEVCSREFIATFSTSFGGTIEAT